VTSLTDDEFKLVYSNLGDRLRVASTAELSGYSRALNRTRCQANPRQREEMFPCAGRFDAATFWSGLRPATPSNVPCAAAVSQFVAQHRARQVRADARRRSGFPVAEMIAAGKGPVVA
jgi:D-amino-acid dehydrogenase